MTRYVSVQAVKSSAENADLLLRYHVDRDEKHGFEKKTSNE